MVMPMCSDGVTDMFQPQSWNLTQFAAGCKKQWGVNTRQNWAITEYGGRNITTASNIIFRCIYKSCNLKKNYYKSVTAPLSGNNFSKKFGPNRGCPFSGAANIMGKSKWDLARFFDRKMRWVP